MSGRWRGTCHTLAPWAPSRCRSRCAALLCCTRSVLIRVAWHWVAMFSWLELERLGSWGSQSEHSSPVGNSVNCWGHVCRKSVRCKSWILVQCHEFFLLKESLCPCATRSDVEIAGETLPSVAKVSRWKSQGLKTDHFLFMSIHVLGLASWFDVCDKLRGMKEWFDQDLDSSKQHQIHNLHFGIKMDHGSTYRVFFLELEVFTEAFMKSTVVWGWQMSPASFWKTLWLARFQGFMKGVWLHEEEKSQSQLKSNWKTMKSQEKVMLRMTWRTGRLADFQTLWKLLEVFVSSCTMLRSLGSPCSPCSWTSPWTLWAIIVTSHSFWPQRPNLESCVESCGILWFFRGLLAMHSGIASTLHAQTELKVQTDPECLCYLDILMFNFVHPAKVASFEYAANRLLRCCCQFVFSSNQCSPGPMRGTGQWIEVEIEGLMSPKTANTYYTILNHFYVGIMPCWHNVTYFNWLDRLEQVDQLWQVWECTVSPWMAGRSNAQHLRISARQDPPGRNTYKTYLRIICMSKHCPKSSSQERIVKTWKLAPHTSLIV